MDVIQEYLDSLANVYTAEVCPTLPLHRLMLTFPQSYDLFMHNCNNFSQDLCMFLVGKGIPEHIRSLPRRVLDTPFGQMLRPQLDQALRGITQAPQPPPPPGAAKPKPAHGAVRNVSNLRELEEQLAQAMDSCAVVFFTSSTCAPCKIMYPTYDELAEEAGDKAVLIKVDVNLAFDVATKYQVRVTPTFMTFLKGKKEDEWSGANPAQLKGNVRLVIQSAHPPHPHAKLRLPSLQRRVTDYVKYTKVPSIEKVLQKIGPAAQDPTIQALVEFVQKPNAKVPADTAVPDLSSMAAFLQSTFPELPQESLFAVVDLVRVAFLDPRVSAFFAEEPDHKTLLTLWSHVSDLASCPYNLRIVMLQLACNLFTTPLYPNQIVAHEKLRETCMRLLTGCLLDSHANLRVVAAALAFNLAAFNHNERFEKRPDKLSQDVQVELVASLVEAISTEEESVEALHGCLLALGLLVYEAPLDGDVVDLCRAMGVTDTVNAKSQVEKLKSEPLLKEIGQELLAKGL